MLPRTLGNSLETCLLVIGTSMLFAPSQSEAARDTEYVSSAALVLASVSVYSRPTAVLLWVSVFLFSSVCVLVLCFILKHHMSTLQVPIFLIKGTTLRDPLWPLIRKVATQQFTPVLSLLWSVFA